MIYANGVHLSAVLENTALVHVLYFSIRHENEHRLYFPTRLSKITVQISVQSTEMTDDHKQIRW